MRSFVVVGLALAAASSAGAQPAAARVVTVGLSVLSEADRASEVLPLPFLDLRVTSMRERVANLDYGVTLFPLALIAPALMGALEIGPALSIATADKARLLLRPGVGIAGVLSPYGMYAVPETYLGLGLVFGKLGTAAFRLDGTAHVMPDVDTPLLRLGVSVGGFTKAAR
jgi:hypothetical protein